MSETSIVFETVGGEQSATVFMPDDTSNEKAPAVVIAPALGIRASYYDRLARALSEAGAWACAVDSPGHGVSPVRPSRRHDWGYAELCEHFAQATRALKALRPEAPVVLLGHSIGGQAALMLTGQYPERVDAVMLVASGSPYWRAWPGVEGLKVLGSVSLCGVLAQVLGTFPGHKVGFGGLEARRLIVEWARVGRTGSYDLEGFAGGELLRQPGPPVRAICVRGDVWAPEGAMRHALAQMKARQIDWVEWLDAPHGGDHNRWPSAPDFVVEQFLSLVKSFDP